MIEPMLGIVFACGVPLVCDGVLSMLLSCVGAAGVGVGECEWICDPCFTTDGGPKSRGSIGVEENSQGARAESAGYAAVAAVARSGWVAMYVGMDCSFVTADMA